ncbi:MAG: DUF4190 domain-containing protein [Protaetiibacter sp.]
MSTDNVTDTVPSPEAPTAASPQLVSDAPAPSGRTNGLAVAALVLGLLGFSIIPVVLGHVSLAQIKKTGDGGAAMAIVGLVLGYLGMLAWLVIFIFVIIGLVWGAAAGNGRGF